MSEATATAPPAAPAAAPPVAVPPVVAPPAAPVIPVKVGEHGEVIENDKATLPVASFAKIKSAAEEKGRKAALAPLEEKIKALGIQDLDAAVAELAKIKAPKTPQEIQIDELNKKMSALEADNVRAKQEAVRALFAGKVREQAVRLGFVDSEYALFTVDKHLSGKTPEELASFDAAAYFSQVKATHPHLFKAAEQAANTGPAGSPPPPPAPGTAAGGGKTFDARTASKQEFESRMRALGVKA